MTKDELEAVKKRAYALNRINAQRAEKCADLDAVVNEIMKLPYGQMKKVLTQPVLEVLAKYGYAE